VPEVRSDAADWKKRLDHLGTLLAREPSSPNAIGHGRNLDAVGEQIDYIDAASPFGDDDDDDDDDSIVDESLAIPRQPKSKSEAPTFFLRSSVYGSLPLPRSIAEVNDGQRELSDRTPWLPGQRLATAFDPRPPTSTDLGLDEAVSRAEELAARRRLLEKWLDEVRVRFASITFFNESLNWYLSRILDRHDLLECPAYVSQSMICLLRPISQATLHHLLPRIVVVTYVNVDIHSTCLIMTLSCL